MVELVTLILPLTIVCWANQFQTMLRALEVIKSSTVLLSPSMIQPLQTAHLQHLLSEQFQGRGLQGLHSQLTHPSPIDDSPCLQHN